MRALAEYVMRERRHAVFLALLFAVLPLCGWISLSIIGLVTLRKGPAEGFQVLLWAALPAAAISVAGQPYLLVDSVLLGSLLLWLMAWGLRFTGSWPLVMQSSVFVLAAILIVVFAFEPNLTASIEKHFMLLSQKLPQKFGVSFWEMGISEAMLKQIIHQAAQIWAGMYAMMVLIGNWISLGISRWMQAALYNQGGFKKEFKQIRMNVIASFFLLTVGFLAFSGNQLALNMMPIALLLFVVAGFSLLHRVSALMRQSQFCLVGGYALVVLLFPYSIIPLVVLSLVDSVINVSQYVELKRKGL